MIIKLSRPMRGLDIPETIVSNGPSSITFESGWFYGDGEQIAQVFEETITDIKRAEHVGQLETLLSDLGLGERIVRGSSDRASIEDVTAYIQLSLADVKAVSLAAFREGLRPTGKMDRWVR